jgi:hypothetical protein
LANFSLRRLSDDAKKPALKLTALTLRKRATYVIINQIAFNRFYFKQITLILKSALFNLRLLLVRKVTKQVAHKLSIARRIVSHIGMSFYV